MSINTDTKAKAKSKKAMVFLEKKSLGDVILLTIGDEGQGCLSKKPNMLRKNKQMTVYSVIAEFQVKQAENTEHRRKENERRKTRQVESKQIYQMVSPNALSVCWTRLKGCASGVGPARGPNHNLRVVEEANVKEKGYIQPLNSSTCW